MAEFRDRLEIALKARGISAAELSKKTGIGEGAISQYRAGRYKASQRNLETIASALYVRIPWLMGLDVPMEAASESVSFSEFEKQLVLAYRSHPSMQEAVCQLLGLDVSAGEEKNA